MFVCTVFIRGGGLLRLYLRLVAVFPGVSRKQTKNICFLIISQEVMIYLNVHFNVYCAFDFICVIFCVFLLHETLSFTLMLSV